MKILNSILDKTIHNNVSADDIRQIKKLVTHLGAIVDFLYSRHELPEHIFLSFKTNQQALRRILNMYGLTMYLRRYLGHQEIDALKNILQMSEVILQIGSQKSPFLAGEEHKTQVEYMIKQITRNNKRWRK